MDLRSPFWQEVTSEWARIYPHQKMLESFKVFSKDQEIKGINWQTICISPDGTQFAFIVHKHYWAKGRKMSIKSEIEAIPSGEYVIIEKAPSNSYDYSNYLVVELVPLVLETPRKAMNWMEREIKRLEASDGKTTEDFVREMNVRRH